MQAGVSSLVPKLSRKAWIVVGADAVSALGNGLIMPFLVIYLRDARGLRIEQAALVLSVMALMGLAVAPLTGWLIDRFGARRTLMAALMLAAIAATLTIWVDEAWEAFGWGALVGASLSSMWPSAHALMASVVAPEQRASVYSVHFAMLNAGVGIGAVLGGLVVVATRPESFYPVFLADAATFLLYAGVLRFVVHADVRQAPDEVTALVKGGWGRLIRDRAFMRVWVLSIGLITVGYAQLQSAFPAFSTKEGGLSTRELGWVFAVNTIVIVGLQLVILRALSGRTRAGAIAWVGVLWAASWVVTLAGGSVRGAAALLLFGSAMALFAFGETFMQAALPALVNDLAPDEIRGRYNAAYSLTWSIGNMAGPAIAGFMLGAGRSTQLFLGLTVACLAASAYSLRLTRFLPAHAARFATGDPAALQGE